MSDALRNVSIIVLWAAVIARWSTVRRGRSPRMLWLALTGCATAFTLDAPGLGEVVDEAVGSPNVSHLVKHCVVLAAAAAAQEVVRTLALPADQARRDSRRRAATLATGLACLTALFTRAPVHDERTNSLTAGFATDPLIVAYCAIFVSYLGFALVRILQITRWYVAHAPAGPLRTGMTAIQLGAAATLSYAAHKVLYLLARLSGLTDGVFVSSMEVVSTALLALSAALLVFGVSWPSIAEVPTVRQLAARRAYRSLYPLWRELYDATPTIALAAPRRRDRDDPAPLRSMDFLLYRRVIEIRDGLLALRPFLSPELQICAGAEVASRERGRSSSVVTEAVCLELARRAKLRGTAPLPQPDAPVLGASDLAGEVRLLQRLARAQPTARLIADQIEAGTPSQHRQAV